MSLSRPARHLDPQGHGAEARYPDHRAHSSEEIDLPGLSGRHLQERLNAAMNRRPTCRDFVGNMDKDADQVLAALEARRIVAGMEPVETSDDYPIWEDAMNRVTGKADLTFRYPAKASFRAGRKYPGTVN
ncbi:hypothetical protein [Neorhizobium sp. DT-125]|uniref:hypothetical protein n=1 Tax=Neorhizobium sp. DT-125 TaxID=3396163 RepID=UPI003F1A6FC1